MIMFIFLLILLINMIFALPMVNQSLESEIFLEGTTVVPHDTIDNILLSNVKQSSNHVYESINALQSAIDLLFPKINLTMDRESLLIGCLIKKVKNFEDRRRICKGLHENNEKNIYYEFDDKALEQNNTTKDINDDVPIHVEHINVARIENNKQKSVVDEIKKLIGIENRFINNTTNKENRNLLFATNQNLINQSISSNKSINTMNLLKSNYNRIGGMFLSSSDIIRKTTNILSTKAPIRSVTQYESNYSIKQQKDDHNQDLQMNEIFSKIDQNQLSLPHEQKPLSLLNEKTKSINTNNRTDLTFLTNNNRQKFEQENKFSNESTIGIWNIARLSNDPIEKNVLLADLTKALETLEILADGKGFDSDGDQISFKPADLHSIMKSRKFSWKFLQFLNTIKNTIEQSNKFD